MRTTLVALAKRIIHAVTEADVTIRVAKCDPEDQNEILSWLRNRISNADVDSDGYITIPESENSMWMGIMKEFGSIFPGVELLHPHDWHSGSLQAIRAPRDLRRRE